MLKNKLNLRNVIAIVICLTATTIFSSCSKDDNPPAISVTDNGSLTQEVFADDEQGKSGVSFTTTSAWTSRISTSAPSAQSAQMNAPANSSAWVSISPDHGNSAGKYTIVIALETNTTGADRSATIAILCDGTEITINVMQKGTTEDGEVPSEDAKVVTNECNESYNTKTTAIVSANVTKVGEPPYTERGICWSSHSNSTINDNKETATGSGQLGAYSCTITGLTANTTYYAKAYLIQDGEVIYGNEISFQTKGETELEQLRALLVKLYNDTNGAGWTNKTNWLSDKSINEWYGITYSSENLKIDLRSNNLIGTIDVSGCTALTYLYCAYNQLTSLNVSGCSELTYLACADNQLTSLNVSGCMGLTGLYCGDNQLTNLNVSGCTGLIGLFCPNNQLTSISVSGHSTLKWLSCENNQLTNLNVTGCAALEALYCNENQLTSLDVNGYTALVDLWCSSNKLESLNVSGCTSLSELTCGNNQLTSLDLSNCPALTYLECIDDQLTNTALNTVFEMLPSVTEGEIYVLRNPGSSTCNPSIAEAKGWTVYR